MSAEHIHDLRLRPRPQERQLRVVFRLRQGFEVGEGVAAAEALGGDVVGATGFVFFVEGAKPHTLVLLVDLSPPAAVGLGDHAFEFRRGELPGGFHLCDSASQSAQRFRRGNNKDRIIERGRFEIEPEK
nr:hypothetical protein Iba_chr06bCG13430 [Ipomoea batatas]